MATTTTLAANRADAQRFLDALDPNGHFWFQVAQEAVGSNIRSHVLDGSLDQVWEKLVQLNAEGAAIWVQINAATGRKNTDVTRVRAYFVDLDGADPTDLLAPESGADILVATSPGKYHGYWLAGDVPLDEFKARQQALAVRFGGDRSVCNLGRVMRLPGLYHHKREPFLTRVVQMKEGK